MIKFYRIKNAESGEYFKRSGCIINSCSEEDAPVYSEDIAKQLVSDANQLDAIMNHIEGSENYHLQPVKIGDIKLSNDEMQRVHLDARSRNISVMTAATNYRLKMIQNWDNAASYNFLRG